jgi:hypothetical protein
MPSPGDLGIRVAKAEEPPVDWNLVDQRLHKLGALSIHRQRLTQGGYRFFFLVPTSQADRVQRVEAVAATEAEAVRLALEKADQLALAAR